MPTTIDVRDTDRTQRRDRVFDALDAADGETVVVRADLDPGPTLGQYRVTRGVDLDVEPDGGDAWRVTAAGDLDGDSLPDFDVRPYPPQRRHNVLTDTFDLLDAGEGFVLVNDHDPKPLYHELASTRGDVVGWEYRDREGGTWRVAITKTGDADAENDGAAATFDVREIPKPDRHPTIHHRYGNLQPGESLDVVAPHEPRHLLDEFDQRYGDDCEWTVLENDPGRVRVRITKRPGAGEGADAAGTSESAETNDERDAESGAAADEAAPDLDVTAELDVRDLPPAQRHQRIFEAYAGLDAGEGFVLVNDHDPKPLYHQFEAEAGPEFRWTYRQRDPGEFRVLIGRAASAADGGDPSGDVDAPF